MWKIRGEALSKGLQRGFDIGDPSNILNIIYWILQIKSSGCYGMTDGLSSALNGTTVAAVSGLGQVNFFFASLLCINFFFLKHNLVVFENLL